MADIARSRSRQPHTSLRISANGGAIHEAVGRATRWSSTSRISRRNQIFRELTKTCISWNGGPVSTRTRSSIVTIDDPTTWTRPWTVKQELKKQSDAANRIYYEPRCHEGNFGLPALLRGRASQSMRSRKDEALIPQPCVS